MKKDGLDEKTTTGHGWTGVENYLVALARRRTARHKREGKRSGIDGDSPQPTLGTVPFLVMMAAFALLFVAIATLAWPVHERQKPRPAEREAGTAAPGWLEYAEKEMNGSQ